MTQPLNRDTTPIICPICLTTNSKDDWDKQTRKTWPIAVSLKTTVMRRDLYADKNYICPFCYQPSELRNLVHKH